MIDRADGMDHIARPEPPAGGEARLAGRAAAETATFLQNLWPASAVDRAVHTPAAEKARVSGIDDGLGVLLGNIAFDQFNARDSVLPGERHRVV